MTKRENIIPYLTIGNLIQEATGKRVAKSAKETGAEILTDITEKIVKKAVLIANHSGRKTVKAKDILLAYNQLRGDL